LDNKQQSGCGKSVGLANQIPLLITPYTPKALLVLLARKPNTKKQKTKSKTQLL
jgi:hypothetical protein